MSFNILSSHLQMAVEANPVLVLTLHASLPTVKGQHNGGSHASITFLCQSERLAWNDIIIRLRVASRIWHSAFLPHLNPDMFQVISGRSVQTARLLAPRSAVLVEAVRGRKSRTDPVAKSKEGRIKVPPPVDPEEMVVLKERYTEYQLIMRALRYV